MRRRRSDEDLESLLNPHSEDTRSNTKQEDKDTRRNTKQEALRHWQVIQKNHVPSRNRHGFAEVVEEVINQQLQDYLQAKRKKLNRLETKRKPSTKESETLERDNQKITWCKMAADLEKKYPNLSPPQKKEQRDDLTTELSKIDTAYAGSIMQLNNDLEKRFDKLDREDIATKTFLSIDAQFMYVLDHNHAIEIVCKEGERLLQEKDKNAIDQKIIGWAHAAHRALDMYTNSQRENNQTQVNEDATNPLAELDERLKGMTKETNDNHTKETKDNSAVNQLKTIVEKFNAHPKCQQADKTKQATQPLVEATKDIPIKKKPSRLANLVNFKKPWKKNKGKSSPPPSNGL